uniref:ANK_REP_REGION domain-containing protein n=1 Tax=Macrostomum lignano TaxID=282301 RepID=A0A1I8F1X7_9PLAT
GRQKNAWKKTKVESADRAQPRRSTASALSSCLEHRFQEPVGLKRPSTGRQLRVTAAQRADAGSGRWFRRPRCARLARTRARLDEGFDVEDESSAAEQYGGVTALMLATHLQRRLPQPANASGITPLMIACFTGAEAVVELLLRYGARVDCRDVAGKTAAHYCCPARALDCLRLLVRAGVPLEADGSDGTSPLMEAAYQGASEPAARPAAFCGPGVRAGRSRLSRPRRPGGSLPTFQRLLRAGASTRAAQPSGVTLLMTAALRYRRRLAELLADRDDEDSDGIRARDAEGRNALFYCVANPEPDLLQLLLDSGLPAEKATD